MHCVSHTSGQTATICLDYRNYISVRECPIVPSYYATQHALVILKHQYMDCGDSKRGVPQHALMLSEHTNTCTVGTREVLLQHALIVSEHTKTCSELTLEVVAYTDLISDIHEMRHSSRPNWCGTNVRVPLAEGLLLNAPRCEIGGRIWLPQSPL